MNKRAIMTATVACLAASAVGAGAAGTSDQANGTAVSQKSSTRSAFGVLRRARTASDRLPARYVGKLADDPALQERQIDRAAARRATVDGGFIMHIVPGRTGDVCLVATNMVTGTDVACADGAVAARQGIVVRTLSDDPQVATGN
jgi:hypothetical protein